MCVCVYDGICEQPLGKVIKYFYYCSVFDMDGVLLYHGNNDNACVHQLYSHIKNGTYAMRQRAIIAC